MIKGFGSVTLWVKDFEKSISFYRDSLGLELLSHPGDIPHFKVGDSFLVLIKGDFCPPSDAFPPDFPQLSFETDNLDMTVSSLQAGGVSLESRIEERRDSRWIKLRDPDGNLIELVQVKAKKT